MNMIEINKKGKEFIAYRTKQAKQTLYIFPLFLMVSVGIGIFKLGFSGISLLFILLTFPVFFIGLYNAAIKPTRIIKNIIIKIEIKGDSINLYSSTNNFKSSLIKRKNNLHVFNVTFLEYYTELFKSQEYYIFPEFFDNFQSVEHNLNLGAI